MKGVINNYSMSVIAIVLCFTSCRQNYEELLQIDDDKKDANMVVDIQQLEVQNISIPIYAIGKVGTANETRLSFKIGGVIESLNVDEGDYIRKGQRIAALRKTEIDAQVSKAQRSYEKSVRDLDRIQRMFDDGAATLENLQDLTTLLAVRKSDLDIAIFNQTYATIVSPVTGRVVKKSAEVNELIGPGQSLVTIAGQGSQGYVLKTGVSDKDLSRIKIGDKTDVRLDAFGDVILEGRVLKISESANPITGTFDIEISINVGKKRIRNGYIGRAKIKPTDTQPLLKIPIESLVEVNDDNVFLYTIVKDSIAKSISVHPVYIADDFIYVNGSDSINNVITTGAGYISDELIVDVRQSSLK